MPNEPSPTTEWIGQDRGLTIELVMQDGTIETTRIADTTHNRQLQDYIARHESFALIHARAPTQSKEPE